MNSERIDPPSRKLDSDITQLYLLVRNMGFDGLALQIGRQDFDEPREWLYDEYLDAVRIFYFGKTPLIFEAAYIHSNIQIKSKMRTWTDLFGQVRWRFDKRNVVRGYFLSRNDTNLLRNREPVYYGLGYDGRISQFFRPWAEIAILRGWDKGEKLKASAIDLGATFIAINKGLAPSLTFGYAAGSGDKSRNDTVENDFRQTGYQDNVGYFGGVGTLHYYGELLDPELSNLKIITAAAGIRPSAGSSFEVIYHSYEQDHPSDKLRSNLVDPPARPNGFDPDLGWGMDFVLAFNNILERASLTLAYAIFNPGRAFSPFQNTATGSRISLKIEL